MGWPKKWARFAAVPPPAAKGSSPVALGCLVWKLLRVAAVPMAPGL